MAEKREYVRAKLVEMARELDAYVQTLGLKGLDMDADALEGHVEYALRYGIPATEYVKMIKPTIMHAAESMARQIDAKPPNKH